MSVGEDLLRLQADRSKIKIASPITLICSRGDADSPDWNSRQHLQPSAARMGGRARRQRSVDIVQIQNPDIMGHMPATCFRDAIRMRSLSATWTGRHRPRCYG